MVNTFVRINRHRKIKAPIPALINAKIKLLFLPNSLTGDIMIKKETTPRTDSAIPNNERAKPTINFFSNKIVFNCLGESTRNAIYITTILNTVDMLAPRVAIIGTKTIFPIHLVSPAINTLVKSIGVDQYFGVWRGKHELMKRQPP